MWQRVVFFAPLYVILYPVVRKRLEMIIRVNNRHQKCDYDNNGSVHDVPMTTRMHVSRYDEKKLRMPFRSLTALPGSPRLRRIRRARPDVAAGGARRECPDAEWWNESATGVRATARRHGVALRQAPSRRCLPWARARTCTCTSAAGSSIDIT